MLTYTLTTPITVGTIAKPVKISSLQLTGFACTTTPPLAPIGAAAMSVTLTDPATGAQETISLQAASVFALWQSVEDAISNAVFAVLLAAGKLPAGALSSAPTTALKGSPNA